MPGVRAKAGLPWPVSGTYICDKCHTKLIGRAGVIAPRCAVLRSEQGQPCNCAYFVLAEDPRPVDSPGSRSPTSPTAPSNPDRDR